MISAFPKEHFVVYNIMRFLPPSNVFHFGLVSKFLNETTKMYRKRYFKSSEAGIVNKLEENYLLRRFFIHETSEPDHAFLFAKKKRQKRLLAEMLQCIHDKNNLKLHTLLNQQYPISLSSFLFFVDHNGFLHVEKISDVWRGVRIKLPPQKSAVKTFYVIDGSNFRHKKVFKTPRRQFYVDFCIQFFPLLDHVRIACFDENQNVVNEWKDADVNFYHVYLNPVVREHFINAHQRGDSPFFFK